MAANHDPLTCPCCQQLAQAKAAALAEGERKGRREAFKRAGEIAHDLLGCTGEDIAAVIAAESPHD